MIKRCSAYKIFCDCCGNQIGRVAETKSQAFIYAIGMGYTRFDFPYYYCSKKCKEKLEKQVAKKGGSND